jgi:hypothetical protein
MKLSNGLKNILEPLAALVSIPDSLAQAIVKVGKRGVNGTYYPNDVKRAKVVLFSTHEVSGKTYEIEVINGDFQEAIERLASLVRFDDFIFEYIY